MTQDISKIFDEFAGMTADEIALVLWRAGVKGNKIEAGSCALSEYARMKGVVVWVSGFDYSPTNKPIREKYRLTLGCNEFARKFDFGFYPFLDRAFPDARHPEAAGQPQPQLCEVK